ncbi:MAG: hypothetical protein ABL999_11205 [Pyrinomonadaceae bacterium]
MNNQWTKFEGRQHGRTARREMRVTIGPRHTIYLNGMAFDAIDRHPAVEMLYDGNRRIIGIKPVDPHKSHAFRVKKHGSSGDYHRISASAFCQNFRLRIDRTLLFEGAELDDNGVLLLDLNRTVTVGRGAR